MPKLGMSADHPIRPSDFIACPRMILFYEDSCPWR